MKRFQFRAYSLLRSNRVYIFLFLLMVFGYSSAGQECWSVRMVKKGRLMSMKADMPFDENGFNLYRNCLYNLRLVDGTEYLARLIDIRPDTLVITSHLNPSVAKKYREDFDTLQLSFTYLKGIKLARDRSNRLFRELRMSEYETSFSIDQRNCNLPSFHQTIFENDTTTYELIPYLSDIGIEWVYESDGLIYDHMGLSVLPGPGEIDTVFRERPVAFIPLFDTPIDQVNGLAIGMMALPSNKKNSLEINGLCVELLTVSPFAVMFGSFLQSDKLVFMKVSAPINVLKKGVNLSLFGSASLGEGQEIQGVSVGGIATLVTSLSGVSITGIHTTSLHMRGACFSGIRNQNRVGRGLQVSLFNSSEDFKGVQIGLWNKNQKRSLPFINWAFH